MNSRLYSLLFAVAFVGLSSAQFDLPHGTANLTRVFDNTLPGNAFQASCHYTVTKPRSTSGQTSDDDWELIVSFHKQLISMGVYDTFPVMAEFRQNGTNMVFHNVRLIEGLYVWPKDGVNSPKQSPMNVVLFPRDGSGSSNDYWKCSVTMKLKGIEAKVRFMSKATFLSSNPNL